MPQLHRPAIIACPGAQELGWSHAASENPQQDADGLVGLGQAFAGVAYMLDGTDNQDPILGIIVVNPNLDSLSETKITTQNYDAEFGKAVASVITAQTKSGSNKFHGSAFDYRVSGANLAQDPFVQGPGRASVPGQLEASSAALSADRFSKTSCSSLATIRACGRRSEPPMFRRYPHRCWSRPAWASRLDRAEFLAATFGGSLTNVTPAGTGILYRPDGTPFPGNVIPASQVSPREGLPCSP